MKRPAALVDALQRPGGGRLTALLAVIAFLALGAYGVVIGTFSGGAQIYMAPLKVSLGAFVSVLICLPSLFIFACLTGAEVSLRGLTGILCGAVALTSLLLIGFAPVVWVFSQSTGSVEFIGALHVIIWLIGVLCGLRLIRILMDVLRVVDRTHIKLWTFIFILVTLQMTTALRPIVGTADTVLPKEKKFFLVHWSEQIFGKGVSVLKD